MSALAAFVEAMDRCWIERRFDALADHVAEDVVLVAPGGERAEGLAAAIGSYRDFMARSSVERYETRDFHVTERGDAAVVEYRWDMDWTSAGESHGASGRELLVLARREGAWRVVWRTQLAG